MRSVLAWLRRHWITFAVLAGLLLGYTLAGFLLLPWIAQKIIHQQVEKLGRKVSIGQLTFNPYTFRLEVAGFRLSEADDRPLIVFNHLLVDAQAGASLWQRGVVLKEIWLSKPDISLIVEADGAINLAKLLPSSTGPEPSGPAALPQIHIGSFAVEYGRIGIEDRSRPQPFRTEISPIAFALTAFRTDPGYENAYAFSGTAASGEELEWKGSFSLQPLGSSGTFALRKLQASTIASYLQDQLPLQLVSGVGELGGKYQLTLNPALALDVELPAIVVRQLAVAAAGADRAAPPLSIAELGVHGVAISLARRNVAVQRVEIKGARVDARREPDGGLNLSRLAGPAADDAKPEAATAKPAPTAEAAAPWRVAVASVQLADGRIALEDRSVSPNVRLLLAPVAVTISGISTDADLQLRISSDIGIAPGGRLRADGDVQLQPLSARFALDLAGFDLPLLQPYLAQTTTATLQSGTLGINGDLTYAAKQNAPAQLGFAGEASVSELKLQDQTLRQDLLRWSELNLRGIDFSQAPDRLAIDSIALSQPFARVVIAPDRSINLSQVMKPKTAAPPSAKTEVAAAAPSKTAAPMPLQIATIAITGGQLSFADQSIEPRFAAAIRELKGSITGLSTAAKSRAKIRLDGRVDRFSPVTISGEASPFAEQQYIDIALSFRNMELTRFNPYSGRFAGYNISKGKLTTELKYRIDDRQLQAEHHVLLDQLEFGEATGSKDAVPLPVKLAVSLLKDRRGVIDLQLPVRGSLDDPAFKIGAIVWKTFTNLMTKIVTAPFAALGSLFGGGAELAWVDFPAGSATLTEAESAKLEKLAAGLIERPQLRLDIPLALDESRDRGALASAALEQRLGSYARVNYAGSTPKDRLRALEQMYRELWSAAPKVPDQADADKASAQARRIAWLEQALIERITPNPEELERLARQRARSVQTKLLAHPEIVPERIFLTTRSSSGGGDAGQVRMELKLE